MYSVSSCETTRPPTTASPSGRRDSRAGAESERNRQGAHQRGHRGHHDGTEAQQAALINAPPRVLACRAALSSAKSIIMMAFFFTMPTSMISPTKRVQIQIHVKEHQREQRAETRRKASPTEW